jgi:AraC-like DNA-binding protein
VGYEDTGTFRRVFKRVIGLSPAEYRRKFHHAHGRTNGRSSWNVQDQMFEGKILAPWGEP